MIKRNTILISAILLSLAGCGGSNKAVDADNTSNITGTVADGYLSGAIVCLDVNGNMGCDPAEPQTISDINGDFTIEATQAQIDQYPIIAEITETTVDSDNPGQPVQNPYVLSSPPGETFVSPLSTVVQHLLNTNPQFDLDNAIAQAHELLGIAQSVELLEDYIKSGETDAHEVAQDIAAILGIELAEAEDLVADNANLDDGDFPNVYAVVIAQIIENADVIAAAETITGTLIHITDLEQEVELLEMEHSLAVASVEEVATNPFHRLEMDDESMGGGHNCDTTMGSCDGSGILSLMRQTIQVDTDGTVSQSEFVYDFTNTQWSPQTEPNDYSEIILGSTGWEVVSDSEQTVEFNVDGTATLNTGSRQEHLTLVLADLSGLPMTVVFDDDDNDSPYPGEGMNDEGHDAMDAIFEQAAEGITFAEGAQGIIWSFETMNDVYEIEHHDGGFPNGCETTAGNCNVVRDANGGPAVTINPGLFYPAESDFTPQLHINHGSIQLIAAEQPDANTGIARIMYYSDSEAQCLALDVCPEVGSEVGQLIDAQWVRMDVNGTEIYKIDIPVNIRHMLDMNGATAIIIAEQNGYVRQGTFIPAGVMETQDGMMFNDAGLTTVDQFLEAVAGLLSEQNSF